VTFVCRSSWQESITATPRAAAMTVWPGAIFFAVLLTASFWPDSARSAPVPAADEATHAVVARDTMVCQSPWHVLEARECRTLSAGSSMETMVTRNRTEGAIFAVDALLTQRAAMNVVPEPSQRMSREQLIRIAEFYPAGLKVGGNFDAVQAPFAPEAYRIENGNVMAGPGARAGSETGADARHTRRPWRFAGASRKRMVPNRPKVFATREWAHGRGHNQPLPKFQGSQRYHQW